jgi:hypothetical protein
MKIGTTKQLLEKVSCIELKQTNKHTLSNRLKVRGFNINTFIYKKTSRLPHFLDNRLTDGGEFVSLTRRLPFTPKNIPGTNFC